MEAWQDITRRAMVGALVGLECTRSPLEDGTLSEPRLHLAPKKLPQSVADEIMEIQTSVLIVGDNLKKARDNEALVKRIREEKRDPTEEEAMELMRSTPSLPPGARDKIYRLALANGVGKHDFADETGSLVEGGLRFDEATVDGVLAWGPLAEECTGIILGYTRPLAKKESQSSDG